VRRAIAFLLDPGPPLWGTLIVRLVLAAVYIPTGLGKFVNHDAYVERFERWGFGAAAGEIALLVGAVEVVAGLMLLLGLAPRLAAAVLAGNMVGALATAGRVDGGQDIWLPLALLVPLAAVIAWGAGRWALRLGGGRRATRRPSTLL
jgi:putative oxidoreductase